MNEGRNGSADAASGGRHETPLQARLQPVRIAVDDDRFCATLVTPAPALPAVMFVHGWNGSQEFELAHVRDAVGLGCAVLAVDLRGHDRDDRRHAQVTRDDNLRDLVNAYDWLVARADVDASAIAVVGFSYGAYLAALLSEARAVRWLALRSPASYPDEGWNVPKHSLEDQIDLDAYRREVQSADSDRALRACARFRGDVLLAAAEHDDVLPPQVMQSYRDALRSTRSITTRILTGADHELSQADSRRDWSELLDAWLREMVIGARREATVEALEARAEAVERAENPHRRD